MDGSHSLKRKISLRLVTLSVVGSLMLVLFCSILIAPLIALLSFTSSQPLNALFSLPKISQRNGAPTSLSARETQSQWLQLLANIPAVDRAPALITPNYQEDQALRVAILAKPATWKEDKESGQKYYPATRAMSVMVGSPAQPVSSEVTQQVLREQSERTIVTARILLGLWQSRRNNERLALDGQIVVRPDEILAWRGVQKHQRRAYVGASKQVSDGYQWRQQQQVRQDMALLQNYSVLGVHSVVVGGKVQQRGVASQYLKIMPLYEAGGEGNGRVMGYTVAPGGWIEEYETSGHRFFAEIDRRILQLNPQNEQHELRIAMYLSEHWRQTSRTGQYKEAHVMSELLRASMIEVDKANLTSRFAPRIEEALQALYQQGIVGQSPYSLTPVDKKKAQWGNSWLASYWCIQPPQDLMQRYKATSWKHV